MKTFAIVLGNNDYHKGATLNNAVNDATAISQIFEKLGFDVDLMVNITKDNIPTILEKLEVEIERHDATIFYFAGHGYELDGENYLASVDCQIPPAGKHTAAADSIRMSEILKIYSKYPNKVNIIIVDACRRTFNRGAALGFTPIQSPRGTLIAFSTSPNDGASDEGYGGHSFYTAVLLEYLGRERLSVEELFKKVRKSVYALTDGRQTTWEHTSLISDYYFNSGQLLDSVDLPYNDCAVMDVKYSDQSDFGLLIEKFKSHNYYKQNDALSDSLKIPARNLNLDQKFIFGRNILQSANGGAYVCKNFIENLANNLVPYQEEDGQNHVLNGILFEMYFDSNGNYRKDKKSILLEEIFRLRKIPQFEKSFDFIKNLLVSEADEIIYIPEKEDVFCDVDVLATNRGEKQIITKISVNSVDITEPISSYFGYATDKEDLTKYLSRFLCIPKDLILIRCAIELKNISINTASQIGW